MLTHLQRLEADSVHIIREAVAESERPVMLYSVGKDSAVLLHLALKAFYRRLIANGKKAKVALTAVMRKILVIANAVARDHSKAQQST